jgi:L-phenylalanine/L-methionine N-acetyltransferase
MDLESLHTADSVSALVATQPAPRPPSPVSGPLYRVRAYADGDGLLHLFNEDDFLRHASTRDRFRSADEVNIWFDHIVAARRFEIVAVVEGGIAGFGGLYVSGDRLSHSGWLMLGVRRESQRRGIGSTLLRLIIETARSPAKLRKLQLTVFTDNAAALRLYRKYGFEVEGLHRAFVRRDAGFVDAYSMAMFFERDDRLDVSTAPVGLAPPI